MPYEDASAELEPYSVGLVSSVLTSANDSWLDPHVQLRLELRSSLSGWVSSDIRGENLPS